MDIAEYNARFGRRESDDSGTGSREGRHYGGPDRGLICVYHPRKEFPDFHYIAQWCPIINEYRRIVPHWLHPRAHFDGYEVPQKIIESSIAFAEAGFQAPYILIAEEKYGTRYFDASTTEKMGQACIKLLTDRMNEGWYFEIKEPEPPEHDLKQFSKGTRLWKTCKEDWEIYSARRNQFLDNERFLKEFQSVVLNRVYYAAYNLLCERSGHEYERIELERMEIVNEFGPQKREAQPQA